MSVLQRIVEKKKERLAAVRRNVSTADLKSAVRDMERPRDFKAAVSKGEGGIRIIAEVKKASPSKGILRRDFDHRAIASVYEAKAVNAISVITEEDFFHGRIGFLDDIHKAVSRPLLRKDFIFEDYQIYEARAHCADAVLLIAAVLEKGLASDLLGLSGELGLGVLFEVHDRHDLDMALEAGAPIIGINNRNLSTMEISLQTTMDLKKDIPAGRVVVSESGIRTREDVLIMEGAGVDALLVGSCLMESEDIGRKLDELRGLSA